MNRDGYLPPSSHAASSGTRTLGGFRSATYGDGRFAVATVRNIGLSAHALLTLYGVFLSFASSDPQLGGIGAAMLLLCSGYLFGWWLVTRRELWEFATPSSLCMAYFYIAFFAKTIIVIYDPEHYYRDQWVFYSPLGSAPPDVWCRALAIFVLAQSCFLIGGIVARRYVNKSFILPQPRRAGKAVVVVRLLVLSALLILFRYYVVGVLGIGRIRMTQIVILGIPNLTGTLVFLSEWVTLCIIAYTCAEAIVLRNRILTLAALSLPFVYGTVSIAFTSSKKELLLAALVVGIVASLCHRHLDRLMRRLALTAIITAFGATLIFYQVFSQYRYHMDSVSLVEFVASNGEFLAPGESAVKMLDRFVGLEALAACVVYYDNEGTTTRAILDENFSYTTEVWGVSYDAGFNMAIGLPGVLLISTGITGIAVGMLVLGGVCCLIDRAALLASNSPFHSAIVAVLLPLLVMTLEGGPVQQQLKRFLFFGLGIGIIHVFSKWQMSGRNVRIQPSPLQRIAQHS